MDIREERLVRSWEEHHTEEEELTSKNPFLTSSSPPQQISKKLMPVGSAYAYDEISVGVSRLSGLEVVELRVLRGEELRTSRALLMSPPSSCEVARSESRTILSNPGLLALIRVRGAASQSSTTTTTRGSSTRCDPTTSSTKHPAADDNKRQEKNSNFFQVEAGTLYVSSSSSKTIQFRSD